jgi:AraC-like DNA-binding protein
MDSRIDVRLKAQPFRYRNEVTDYQQFYLIIVLTGTLFFRDAGGEVPVEHGRMAVLRPGSSFTLYTKEGGYSGVAVERLDQGLHRFAGPSMITEPSPRIALLGEWIAEELSLPGEHSEPTVQHLAGLVEEIALRATHARPAGEPQLARSRNWARRARQAIENSIYTTQGVREVLAAFPISYRQLARFLADEFGTSPKQLQLEARLREAKRLLRETDWSLVTIALELGFSSPQHFSTLFHAREQMIPSRWRDRERSAS